MRPRPTIRKVVKFSKSCHALFQVTNLRLSTPDYYRDEEGLTTGIADPYDSMLNKDAFPWARRRYSNPSVKMKVNMRPECNPWVYCTSHMSSQSEFRKL